MGIPRSPVPKRLVDPQQEEEEPEGIDNEQFLLQLAGLLIHIRTHFKMLHMQNRRINSILSVCLSDISHNLNAQYLKDY